VDLKAVRHLISYGDDKSNLFKSYSNVLFYFNKRTTCVHVLQKLYVLNKADFFIKKTNFVISIFCAMNRTTIEVADYLKISTLHMFSTVNNVLTRELILGLLTINRLID